MVLIKAVTNFVLVTQIINSQITQFFGLQQRWKHDQNMIDYQQNGLKKYFDIKSW